MTSSDRAELQHAQEDRRERAVDVALEEWESARQQQPPSAVANQALQILHDAFLRDFLRCLHIESDGFYRQARPYQTES